MQKKSFLSAVTELLNCCSAVKLDVKGFDVRCVTEDVVKGFLNFYYHKKPRVFILENRIPLKVEQGFIDSVYIEVLIKNKVVQGIKPLKINGNLVFFSIADFMSIYHPVKCVCGKVSVPLSNYYSERCVCGRAIDIGVGNDIEVLTLEEVTNFIGGDKNAL